MKHNGSSKISGGLLIASGFAFFITAGLMRQPAFSSVGGALVIIGIILIRKSSRR